MVPRGRWQAPDQGRGPVRRRRHDVLQQETGNQIQLYWGRTLSGQRGPYGYYRVRSNNYEPNRGFMTVGKVASKSLGFFIQDSWTIGRRLTLFLVGLFLVGLGALVWRTIVGGSRYLACVQVTRNLVRPLLRPDPWKHSVGGPGGPRYPIDGDEYGVAL